MASARGQRGRQALGAGQGRGSRPSVLDSRARRAGEEAAEPEAGGEHAGARAGRGMRGAARGASPGVGLAITGPPCEVKIGGASTSRLPRG